MSIFFHEQLYRTDTVMALLKNYPVTIWATHLSRDSLHRRHFEPWKFSGNPRLW